MSEKQSSDWPLATVLIVLILSVSSCVAYDRHVGAQAEIAKSQSARLEDHTHGK